MSRRLSWLLVLTIVGAVASSAHAETVAWNGFRPLGVPDPQVAVLAYVVTAALDEGGLVETVVDQGKVAERCGVDVACHCEQLRDRGVRYGSFGTMSRLGDLWTIELTLLDAHSCSVASSAYFSEALVDDAVAPRLAALTRQLTTPPSDVAASATAAGVARPIDATPAVVSSFTRAQLRALHVRSLDELFPLVPGFDVIDASWGGVVLNQGLPSTLLFLSDGAPLVNGLNGFRALGRDFRTSLTHIDRIEIVRGPGAVLWGQNAFLGVVNMITETPTRRQAAVDAGIAVGTQDSQQVWARGEQNRGPYAFAASVDVGRRVGPATYVPDSPFAVVGVPAPFTFGNGGTTQPSADVWLDAHLRLAFDDRVTFDVLNLTSDVEFEISPRGPLLEPGRGGYWRKTHRLYSLVGTQPIYEAVGAAVKLRASASRYELYSWENFAIHPRWPAGPEPVAPGRDQRLGLRSIQGNDEPRVAHQGDVRVVHDYSTSFESHFTAGIGVLHQHTPRSLATLVGVDEEVVTPFISFGKKEYVTLSAFSFEELTPAPWLVLTAGARAQVDSPYVDTRPWRFGASFQGGAAVQRGAFAGKLVYAEGLRPPDAVQIYSRAGTKGNEELEPEQSRELAAVVAVDPVEGLTVRGGGNLTRISSLITLVPIVNEPMFAYTPENGGRIDLASGFIEAQLTSRWIDGFASWHITGLRESKPVGDGIPLARHTAALAAIWRPIADLSVFVRGSFASPRKVRVITAADPDALYTTDPTIRTAIGLTLTDVFSGADFELTLDNPLLLEHDAPYQLDGTPAGLVERRRGTELFATLRYDR